MYLTKMLSRTELQREPVPDKDIVLLPTGIFPWCDVAMTMRRQDWDEVYVECRAVEPDIEPVFSSILSGTNPDLIRAFGTMESVQSRYTELREQLAEQENPELKEKKQEPEPTTPEMGEVGDDVPVPETELPSVEEPLGEELTPAPEEVPDTMELPEVLPSSDKRKEPRIEETPAEEVASASSGEMEFPTFDEEDDDLNVEALGKPPVPPEKPELFHAPEPGSTVEVEPDLEVEKPRDAEVEPDMEAGKPQAADVPASSDGGSWVDMIQQARAEEEQEPRVDVPSGVPGFSELFGGGLLGDDLGEKLEDDVTGAQVSDKRASVGAAVETPKTTPMDAIFGLDTSGMEGKQEPPASTTEPSWGMLFGPDEFLKPEEHITPEQMMDAALEMTGSPVRPDATPKIEEYTADGSPESPVEGPHVEEYDIPSIEEMAGPSGPTFEEIAAKAATTAPPEEADKEPELTPKQQEDAKAFQEIMDAPESQPASEQGPSDSLKMEIVGIRQRAMESGEVQYTARESKYIAPCVKLFASMYSDYRVTFMNVSLEKIISSNNLTTEELARRIRQVTGKAVNSSMMEASEKFLQVYVEAYCVALEKMESGDEESALAIAKVFAGLIYEE